MKKRVVIRLAVAALAVSASLQVASTPARAITGGRLATQQYPHMAALFFKGDFMCGASLVAPEWILTAAHCMLSKNPADFTFVLGRQNFNDSGGEAIQATLMNIHESYGRPKPDSHDVALLKLARPSSYAPIRVASPATERPLWAPGQAARVIGYGGLVYPGVGVDGNLREVDIPMVSDADCAASYAATGDFDPTTMVCAGELYGTKDSCQGDSGGPLMVRDGAGAFIQVGVVSWGFGCGYPTQYGVYSRVGDTALYDWIQARIGSVAPAPATITGKVTDSKSKAGIAAATVACGIGGSAASDASGVYAVTNVPVATHTCTASKSGYASKTQTVTVTPGGTATLDFALRKQ